MNPKPSQEGVKVCVCVLFMLNVDKMESHLKNARALGCDMLDFKPCSCSET